MNSVYKYIIKPDDYFELQLPKNAKVLSVQEQHGNICLWALVEPGSPTETRKFRFAGTGHPIHETKSSLKFIGTFQMYNGDLVFHIFEIES